MLSSFWLAPGILWYRNCQFKIYLLPFLNFNKVGKRAAMWLYIFIFIFFSFQCMGCALNSFAFILELLRDFFSWKWKIPQSHSSRFVWDIPSYGFCLFCILIFVFCILRNMVDDPLGEIVENVRNWFFLAEF